MVRKSVREKLLLSCRARSAPYLAQKSWLSRRREVRLEKLVISSACEIISSILVFLKTSVTIMAMKCKVDIPQDCDFTLNNLPYGVFTVPPCTTRRIGVAIGNHVLSLATVKHFFNSPYL